MTTLSTAPTPTLPSSWSMTGSHCLLKDNYWIWDYGTSIDARMVIGSPAQTTDCFSPKWNPTITFFGSACPAYYTSACQDPKGVVTCCPWIDHFSCQPETWDAVYHASEFRCQSQYTHSTSLKAIRTIINEGITRSESTSGLVGRHLFALALMYTTPMAATHLLTALVHD
ncbi:hypothetical protein F4861DRAFT_339463 [Xylaria intraflava]|nr:hypothetical protein F4861DRAFT_339463 [Xylaria intraflava]